MYPNCFETAWRESCVSTIPKRSSFEHATFDSQALYIQALTNSIALSLSPSKSVSVSPTGSHTSKELHIYIKKKKKKISKQNQYNTNQKTIYAFIFFF